MFSPLLTLLDRWAIERADQPAYIFLNSFGQEEGIITYQQLRKKAVEIAACLGAKGMREKRIVLALPQNVYFIVAFLGCLYAKAIAVPLPPPKSKRQLARSIPVIQDATAALILIEQKLDYDFKVPTLSLTDLLGCEKAELPQISEMDIAFLQYTSGSTSLPKGVVLTHSHLYHHQQVIQKAFRHDSETKIVGWLPFYHDMGLIGNILQTLYLGVTSILMTPMTFMQRPILWLEAISRYRATTSGGPNFAYQHCISKIADSEIKQLDLSSWKLAFNGAERIHTETLNGFSKRFSPWGFQPAAFYPCYGMAETTLFATGRQSAFSISFQTAEGSISDVVSCGMPNSEHQILIVNPITKEPCLEGTQGEIWVQGPSVAAGYWNKEKENKETFQAYTSTNLGPFLRTGDLGFLKEKELFLLGRLKNLLIIRGKNYFPHDLETCVKKAHPLLAYTQGVVISQSEMGSESLVVLQEISRDIKDISLLKEIVKAIREALIEDYEISPAAIVFVIPNSLPRTTSGKLQHYLAREQFQNQQLSLVFSWQQEKECLIQEENIKEALAELLGIASHEISPNEPIVSLGVDSLAGMQFANWIRAKFGIEIDLAFLLNGATLHQVEERIKQVPGSSLSLHSSIQSEYPLSWNQENLWTFHQLNPRSLSYNIHFALRIKGVFNPIQFQEALKRVIARHSALRTRFEQRSPAPVQIIEESIELPFTVHPSIKETEIIRLLKEERQFCFDLSKAPLFRIILFPLSNQENILSFHFHHLICDGWSIGILIKELEKEYEECDCPAPRLHYGDFIDWQQKFARSSDYTHVENKWKELLKSNEYPILEISPFLNAEKNLGAGSISFFLEKSRLSTLKSFAAKQQVTLPVILMATFHAMLHLYSGENSVYVGYPAVNRPEAGFQEVIGMFVNTLVCKTEATAESTFLNLIQQVKKSIWQGPKESTYPLQHLLNLLRPPRFAHTSPLFQAMFVMQNAPVSLKRFASLEIELVKADATSSLYDLVLEVQEKGEELELIFEYQKEKISLSFAAELKECYSKLLMQAVEHPIISLGKLALTKEKEESPIQLPEELDVVAMIERQATKNQKKIAILSDRGDFTYEELNHRVSSIASQLLEQGIKPGEPIGICLEKTPILIATLLGILKAGGAYVPIDPIYPSHRIQAMIENADIRFVLTEEKFHSALSFFRGSFLDPYREMPSAISFPSFVPKLSAYILYTSGTTGMPKGVVVERQSLGNFALAALNFFEMNSSDRSLQFSSISWDTSSEEIYPCLLIGGTLVLRSDGPVESFDALIERTEKKGVTIWNLPSSYWHDLVEMMDRKKIAPPPSLRLVIVGGEKVNRSKVELWCQRIAPHVKLLNTYGATEATSISAIYDLAKWRPEWKDTPAGYPIRNVELCVLNSFLERVLPGMPGTLYIGGAGLSRGYHNMPKLTAEKFIVHPKSGKRLYNTGDSAYYSLTGEILIKGRKDRQVKRRGFRVELEEIEKTLLKQDQVETCLITFDQVMIAYIVLKKEGSALSAQFFKSFLRQSLPDYFIPDHILFLPTIPRLPNGKIDFVSLKSMHTIQVKKLNKENLTETETKLLAIWQSILGTESISKEDSFFDVGGNSLLLIQLHEKIQESFLVQINISILFSHFTITSQAQKIEENKMYQLCAGQKRSKISKIELLKKLEQGLISPIEAQKLLAETDEVK